MIHPNKKKSQRYIRLILTLMLPWRNTQNDFNFYFSHRNQLMRREVGYKETIKQLQYEVKDLSEEVEKLKSYLKTLIQQKDIRFTNDNSPQSTNIDTDHIHSKYKDLFITDLKVEV